jgi:hypothetical protein
MMARSATRTTYEIMGYSGYTQERYNHEATAFGAKVNAHLGELPADYFEEVAYKALAEYSAGHERVSLVDAAGASAQLKLGLYYYAAPDYVYAGLRARVYNAKGAQVYDRAEFSDHWKPASLKKNLTPNIERFLHKATKKFWKDISQ